MTARDRSGRRGLALSLLLHAAAIAALLALPQARHPEPAPVEGIAVEVVAPSGPREPIPPLRVPREPAPRPAAPSPAPIAPSSPMPSATPPAPAATPQTPPAMIRPSRMLSAARLADPRSREARAILAQTAPEDRAIQLCSLEATAQVAVWNPALRPDMVVAYAMAEIAFAADTLTADGAAVRSGGRWYLLRFVCSLDPGRGRVTAFAFRVGEAIPKRLWADHALAGDDGPLD